MTYAFSAAVALLATAPTPAEPAPPSQEDSHLKRALNALSEADFDLCLREVDAGVKAPPQDDRTLAELFLARARCLAALQRFGAVEAALTQALEHDPEARLDPKRVLPTLVVTLDSLKVRLRGDLEVQVRTPGALLAIDGEEVGPAPLRRSVGIGRHHVVAHSRDGVQTAAEDAVVRPNQATPLVLALPPRPPPVDELVPFPPDPTVQLQIDLLGAFDPINGFSLGGGPTVRGTYWFAGLHGAMAAFPSVDAQVGGRLPRLVGPFGLFAHLDGTVLLLSSKSVLGGGVAGGLIVTATPDIEVFAEGGARLYSNAPFSSPGVATLSTGIRIRVL
jgi:hypothetical protein